MSEPVEHRRAGLTAAEAGARLARTGPNELPRDVDMFAEIQHVAEHLATHHGDTIARQIGLEPGEFELDLSGVKNSFGVDGAQSLTHRQLQERRQLMQKRMEAHQQNARRKKK